MPSELMPLARFCAENRFPYFPVWNEIAAGTVPVIRKGGRIYCDPAHEPTIRKALADRADRSPRKSRNQERTAA